jgi:hypothetical protein
MARTSLQDVAGLPDPLLSYNFDLIFPSIPGGGNSRSMTVKCMSTALPGMQLEQQTAALHGVEVNYAGRQIWTKTFQATFIETRDAGTRAAIRRWIEFARNNRFNSGNYKSQYAVDAVMQLYDDIPAVINTTKIVGCFPTQLDDVNMDGSQGTIVQVSVTFSYDWTEEQ